MCRFYDTVYKKLPMGRTHYGGKKIDKCTYYGANKIGMWLVGCWLLACWLPGWLRVASSGCWLATGCWVTAAAGRPAGCRFLAVSLPCFGLTNIWLQRRNVFVFFPPCSEDPYLIGRCHIYILYIYTLNRDGSVL